MRLHEIDTLPFESLRVDRITKYLIGHGWKQVPFPQEGLLVFEGPEDDDGEPIVQVIPRSERSSDFSLSAAQLVRALSVIEDRPVEEIRHEIQGGNVPTARRDGPAKLGRRTWAQRALSSVVWAAGFVLFLGVSESVLLFSLVDHPAGIWRFLVPMCTSGALAGIAGSLIMWRQAEIARRQTEEAIRRLQEKEDDLAAETQRLSRELTQIGKDTAQSNGTVIKAYALSLIESIEHGDEWLKIKSIDALVELAEADHLLDMAEPALASPADSEGSTPAVREAASEALNRVRQRTALT